MTQSKIPQAALGRASELVGIEWANRRGLSGIPAVRDYGDAFARYIAEVSDMAKRVNARFDAVTFAPGTSLECARNDLSRFILSDEPDPLVIEAREIAAKHCPDHADAFLLGVHDKKASVEAILAALKRGKELADGK